MQEMTEMQIGSLSSWMDAKIDANLRDMRLK
jgi:hypothetical protein